MVLIAAYRNQNDNKALRHYAFNQPLGQLTNMFTNKLLMSYTLFSTEYYSSTSH